MLSLLVGCSTIVYSNLIVPRVTASEHTAELCEVMQYYEDATTYAYQSGDVSHLHEIFKQPVLDEEISWFRYAQEQDLVGDNIIQIVRCDATYYTSQQAELHVTERLWERTKNKHTGEIVAPPPTPFFTNMARESEFVITFVHEDNFWKYQSSSENWWQHVRAEPPKK
jgi:hypothetical protein